MSRLVNFRKYLDYIFDNGGYDPGNVFDRLSPQALCSYQSMRGKDHLPSIIIHGIMKRSGTVYVGQLLSLHPDLFAHPNNIWEVPFLPLTRDVARLQDKFLLLYDRNRDQMGSDDFLPLFGGAIINYLYGFVPDGQRMLLKIPSVQYLNNFYSVFPGEDLIVLVRDGRDVVTSTIKTWPQIQFSLACRRWDLSARMVLACDEQFNARDRYLLAKYEDAVKKPEDFVTTVLNRFGVDSANFPFERMEELKVIGSSTTIRPGEIWGEIWVKKTEEFKPIGRWEQWSAWKKSVFKLIAGKSLVRLGYSTGLEW